MVRVGAIDVGDQDLIAGRNRFQRSDPDRSAGDLDGRVVFAAVVEPCKEWMKAQASWIVRFCHKGDGVYEELWAD